MSRLAHGLAFMLLGCFIAGCNYTGSTLDSTKGFPPNTGFFQKKITVDGKERSYYVFVPRNWRAGEKYPAIVFLHGVLEAGDSGKNVGKGLGPHISKDPSAWPFITLFPQSDGDWQGAERGKFVIACIDQGIKDLGVDPDRVLLTGLSNGGQGTWIIGGDYRDRFAALVPMCGHKAYDSVPKLTKIPIWCFHNNADLLVGSGQSEEMVKRINAAGGNAKLTTYGGMHEDFNHNVWDQAYAEPQLIPWMLAQRRNGAAKVGGN